jgi:guanylate kinase
MDKRVLIISGPTGCGESTITNEIVKRFPVFKRLVSATTRPMRVNEQEAVSYYFLSEETFKDEIAKGNIIEHTYIKNRAVYYGSYKPDLDKKIAAGFNIIANPDIVGAKYFKENYNATTIFIKPDFIENIRKRILNREPDITDEELNHRLVNAEIEIATEMSYYDFVVTNKQDKLKEAVEEIIEILKREGFKLS